MSCFGSASLFSKAPHLGSENRPSLPIIIDENDDDERVLSKLFTTLDKNRDKKFSRAEIEDVLNISSSNKSLANSGYKFLELFDIKVKNFEDKRITLDQLKTMTGKADAGSISFQLQLPSFSFSFQI